MFFFFSYTAFQCLLPTLSKDLDPQGAPMGDAIAYTNNGNKIAIAR